MIKKIKITCNKTNIKPLDHNLSLNNLLSYTEFQFTKSFEFYTEPKPKDKTIPQIPEELKYLEYKDEELNLSDDDVLFTLLTESLYRDAKTTLAEESEGENPNENKFIPQFLKVDSIKFNNGKMTIEFKDSDKKYVRNLAHIRLYNHIDPDPQDDFPEDVNGAIFDAMN